MILLDFSPVVIANLHTSLKDDTPLEPDILRHMILNSIRRINHDFKKSFGQLVICTDNSNYWRYTHFKYYKASRKKSRDASEIDWKLVFEILDELRTDLRKIFPYKVMNVPGTEADDVIAILAQTFKTREPILIVSPDSDFVQLLDKNVSIYRPSLNEYVEFTDTPIDIFGLISE